MSLDPHNSVWIGNPEHRRSNGDSDEWVAALRVCRDALADASAEAPLSLMRKVVGRLATAAHRLSIPPERLIVGLKEVLAELPQFDVMHAATRNNVMRDLITSAITSYYAPRAD